MVTRIVLAIVGAMLLIAGLAAGAAAVWGYTSVGTEGVVRVPVGTVTPDPSTRATILDVATFRVTAPYVGGLGESELVVTPSPAGSSLFIGAAATPDADAFLTGVPYSVALRDGDGWVVRSVPGGKPPESTASGRWLVTAEGTAPAISVPDQRPLSLVVLDPAGGPAPAFELAVMFTIADASAWLLGLAIGAAVLTILGVVLLLVALLRRRGTAGKHAAGQPLAAPTEEPETSTVADVEDASVEGTEAGSDDDEVVDGIAYVIDPEDEAHDRG